MAYQFPCPFQSDEGEKKEGEETSKSARGMTTDTFDIQFIPNILLPADIRST